MFSKPRSARVTEAAQAVAAVLRASDALERPVTATALAALLAARHLDHPVDLTRVLELALARALAGCPDPVRAGLDPDNRLHVGALLLELETAGTSEAKLVHALDSMLRGGGYGGRDRFLGQLGRAVAGSGDARAAG